MTIVAKASLRRLDEIAVEADWEGRNLDRASFNDLRSVAIARIDTLKAGDTNDEKSEVWMARREIRQSMLDAERDELDRLRNEHLAPGEVLKELTRELDIRQQVLGDPGTS